MTCAIPPLSLLGCIEGHWGVIAGFHDMQDTVASDWYPPEKKRLLAMLPTTGRISHLVERWACNREVTVLYHVLAQFLFCSLPLMKG